MRSLSKPCSRCSAVGAITTITREVLCSGCLAEYVQANELNGPIPDLRAERAEQRAAAEAHRDALDRHAAAGRSRTAASQDEKLV